MRMKPKYADIGGIWNEYRNTCSVYARNVLLEKYLPIVKYNAERIATRLPREVEQDDLISAGIFGLMDAIDGFDLDRGVKFETYCAPRVRGAMLDELRSMDWAPREARSRADRLEQLYRRLETTLRRKVTEAEVAESIGMQPDEFHELRRRARLVKLESMDSPLEKPDSYKDEDSYDIVIDRSSPDPFEEARRKDLKNYIVRGLTRTERLIMILYYYEEMTQDEIGLVLDLSQSRVSQMHSDVLKRLGERFAFDGDELVKVKDG